MQIGRRLGCVVFLIVEADQVRQVVVAEENPGAGVFHAVGTVEYFGIPDVQVRVPLDQPREGAAEVGFVGRGPDEIHPVQDLEDFGR